MRAAAWRWKERLVRLVDEATADRIDLIAGGIAFYALLALFPMLLAALSLYGLVMSPTGLEAQLDLLSDVMPGESGRLVVRELRAIYDGPSQGLTLQATVAMLVALYSASRGTDALIQGIGIAYDEPESRSLLRLKLLGFTVTICLIVGVFIAFMLIAVVPLASDHFGLEGVVRILAEGARWPVLLILFVIGLSSLYRVAPASNHAEFGFISWGSIVATIVWLLASYGFSVYVAHFGNYQAMYGSLGGAIVLLLWLWLSALAILLGAEVDAVFHRP